MFNRSPIDTKKLDEVQDNKSFNYFGLINNSNLNQNNYKKHLKPLIKLYLLISIILFSLILIGLLFLRVYSYFNTTVYLLNGFDKDISISVDNRPAIVVNSKSVAMVTVTEGMHKFNISGATDEVITKDIKDDLWSPSSRTFFAINPRAKAFLYEYSIGYGVKNSKNPDPVHTIDNNPIYWGELIKINKSFDYYFTPLPEKIYTDSYSADLVYKTRIDYITDMDATSYINVTSSYDTAQAINFLEEYLRVNIKDSTALLSYRNLIAITLQFDRGIKFIKLFISNENIDVDLHRVYQDFISYKEGSDKLISEYDSLLKLSPINPDLLYLRARISKTTTELINLCNKALEIKPDYAYCLYVLGDYNFTIADFNNANTYLEKAFQLNPDHYDFFYAKDELNYVLKNWKQALKDLDSYYVDKQKDYIYYEYKAQVLIESGQIEQAKSLFISAKLTDTYSKNILDELIGELTNNPSLIPTASLTPGKDNYSVTAVKFYDVLTSKMENVRKIIDLEKQGEVNYLEDNLMMALYYKFNNDPINEKLYIDKIINYESNYKDTASQMIIKILNDKQMSTGDIFNINRSYEFDTELSLYISQYDKVDSKSLIDFTKTFNFSHLYYKHFINSKLK